MTTYPCPHCGQRSISLKRRLSIGPARPVVCTACGGRVGVPWGTLWLIPLSLGVAQGTRLAVVGFSPAFQDYLMGAGVGLVVGTVFFLWMWVRWVQLVKQ